MKSDCEVHACVLVERVVHGQQIGATVGPGNLLCHSSVERHVLASVPHVNGLIVDVLCQLQAAFWCPVLHILPRTTRKWVTLLLSDIAVVRYTGFKPDPVAEKSSLVQSAAHTRP